MQTVPTTFAVRMLARLLASGGDLHAPVLKLFTNQPDLSRTTVKADLTEATFTGYAASAAVVWLTPYVNVLGQAQVEGDLKQWVATDAVVLETVYGYWIESAGGDLIAAAYLDDPVTTDLAGRSVEVLPSFAVSPSQAA